MRLKQWFLFSTIFPCHRLIHSCVVRFSASVGAELCSLFLVLPFLQDRCASGMRCLVPTLAAQLVRSQQPLVVGSPSAVTVCPAPVLAVQGVGHSFLYPLAASVC